MEEALAAEAAKHTTALEAALAAERCAQMWPHMQSAVLGHCVQSELHCPLLQFQRSFRCPAGRTEGWIRCDDGGGEGISSMIYAPLSFLARSLPLSPRTRTRSLFLPLFLSLYRLDRSLLLPRFLRLCSDLPACLPPSAILCPLAARLSLPTALPSSLIVSHFTSTVRNCFRQLKT